LLKLRLSENNLICNKFSLQLLNVLYPIEPLRMEQQLDEVEDSVFRIMEVAKQTLEKLKSLPLCNEQEIEALSDEYARLVGEVQRKLKVCSGDILSSSLTPGKAQYASQLKDFIEGQLVEGTPTK
jgi:signal transduction histidine kinase